MITHLQLARGPRWRFLLGLIIYNTGLALGSPLLVVWLCWRSLVRHKPLGSLRHKLGLVPRAPEWLSPRLWLHAVSAGEMAALKPVYEALREAIPNAYIVISTITPAGMEVARKTCATADALFFLPFDLAPCMALALQRVRPDVVVVTEKELWPNLLGLARLSGAATVSVNGRVSQRALHRARVAGRLTRWQYGLLDSFCVQSRQDADRLGLLGVPPERVVLAGNTKADAMADRDLAREQSLAHELGVREGDVWLVAGSTHPGEEEAVVAAFACVRAQLPAARLLLAPRHLARVAEVCACVAQRDLPVACRSEGRPPANAVVVLDTMGELRACYGIATAGFVGGTLVPIGGHNLLEPVAAGRAVLFGPHTESCHDVAELVLEAGVGSRVSGAEELADAFLRIARDDRLRADIAAAGARLIEAQRGAAQRCANIAVALLQEASQ